MKKLRRKIASLLIFVMVMAMCVPAFAGTIEIRNATPGTTYTAYKVFDLTYADGGDGVAYTYTKAETDSLFDYLTEPDSPFKLVEASPSVYNVTLKDKDPKYTGQEIAAFFKGHESLFKESYTGTISGSKATFEGVPEGYYYITSTLGSTVTIDSTIPNVVVIDKNQQPSWDNATPSTPTDPEDPYEDPYEPGKPGNGKVIIGEGADSSNLKNVFTQENSVSYGDTVKFSISVNATAYARPICTDDSNKENYGKPIENAEPALVTYYHITDTLDAAFNPAENITVKVIGPGAKWSDEDAADPFVKTLKDTDYTIAQNGNTFDICIPYFEKYLPNAKIEVQYTATLKDTDAVKLGSEGNKNTTNFTYEVDEVFDPDDPPYDPKDPEDPDTPAPPAPKDPGGLPWDATNEKTTTTYVYAIAIQKKDQDEQNLAGAKFSVKDKDGKYLKAATTGTKGIYSYAGVGTGTFSESENLFETSDNGLLVIKGISFSIGEDGPTYTIKEEKAPDGYNKLENTIQLDAILTEKYTQKTVTKTLFNAKGEVVSTDTIEEDPEYEISGTVSIAAYGMDIINQKGTELPATGGAGTTLLIVLGSILFMGTAVVLVSKKRLYNESR